jgi:nucleotide-binding universal stress UspA family protein
MGEQRETLVQPAASARPVTSRVVVGVDGTAANWSAVAWAVAEARRGGYPLVLVAVGSSDAPGWETRTENLDIAQSEHLTRDLLDDVRERLQDHVDDLTSQVFVGDPSHALVRCTTADDLLVVGKRGGHPFSRTVLGSTSMAVAGRCLGPVVVVPEDWSVVEHLRDPIVAGTDWDRDPEVLDLAFDRAQRLGVGLVVVHAWDGPGQQHRPAEDAPRAEEAQTRLDAVVEPWRQRHPDVEVRTASHPLTPAVSLLGVGASGQLLVLGRHTGPQHPGGLRVGSTTRNVLHHAPCPVVVVPKPPTDTSGSS